MKATLKKIFVSVIILIITAYGSQSFAQTDTSFVLKGEIKGYGNGQVIFSYSNPNERVRPDTVPVRNDKFILKGSLKSPLLTFLKIMNNGKLKRNYFVLDFILENVKINFIAAVDNLKDYSLTGSPNTVLLKNIIKDNRDSIVDYLKVERKYNSLADGSKEKERLGIELERKKQAYLDYLLHYKDYFNSYAGTYSLWMFSKRRIPWQQLDTILTHFDKSVRNSTYFKYMKKVVDAAKSLQPGEMAPDFVVKDLKGKEYTLKSFRGHYLLMTFSASWCGPCKLEYPFLRKAYEKYADKGLKMAIMNVDDSRDKWAGDVKKYNFPFPILSDQKAFTGDFTKRYGVFSIPKVFLIDPDGKIVSGTIRQQRILDKLEDVYH